MSIGAAVVSLPCNLLAAILPTRGSIMLDVIFLATFAIVVVMAISIYLVRFRRKYKLHARIQVALCVVLLIAITAFEIDLRFFTDWRSLARPSPYYESGWVDRCLFVHLCFAVPTPLLWLTTIVLALRRFGWEAVPGRHSANHRILGRVAASAMIMTTFTGWAFYYLAFAAT